MSEALGLFNLHHCNIITKIHRMNWSLATQTSEDTETFLRLPRGKSKFGKATITPQGHVTIVLGTWLEKEHKPFPLFWEQAALAPLPAVDSAVNTLSSLPLPLIFWVQCFWRQKTMCPMAHQQHSVKSGKRTDSSPVQSQLMTTPSCCCQSLSQIPWGWKDICTQRGSRENPNCLQSRVLVPLGLQCPVYFLPAALPNTSEQIEVGPA